MSSSIGTITIANEEILSICSICARSVRIISTVITYTEKKSKEWTFFKADFHRKIVHKNLPHDEPQRTDGTHRSDEPVSKSMRKV